MNNWVPNPSGYMPVPPPPAPVPEKLYNKQRRREYNSLGYALFVQAGISMALTFAMIFGVVFFQVFEVMRTGNPPDVSDVYNLIPLWLIPAAMAVSMLAANTIPAVAFSNRLGLNVRDMFRPKATTIWVVLGGAAVCFALNYSAGFLMQLLNTLLSGAGVEMTTPDIDLNYGTAGNIAMLLYTVIIAPITEELLCRGLLLRTLQRTGRVFAIVGSSLLFAMIHGNFLQSVPTFLIGLVLGYIAIRCGSILPTILIHIINNGYVMLIQALAEPMGDALAIVEYVGFGIFLLGAVFVLWRERARFRLLGERKAQKGSYGLFFTSWAVLVNLIFYFGISLLFIQPIKI